MVNAYSPEWHALFGATVDPAQTEREADFLARVLPLPAHRRVLDVCCGAGRHLSALAARGFAVMGVERDAAVAPPGALVLDVRELWRLDETFDAVISMWQSFGWFDDATNLDVLRQMAGRVRPDGRVVLDVYHRGFFEGRTRERKLVRAGRTIGETSELRADRLHVRLGTGDEFEWRLYTPEELSRLAGRVGLSLVLACTWFDEERPPSAAGSRMQLVFERS